MINRHYAELHGNAMDFKDGSTMHSVAVSGSWGILAGIDAKDRPVLRVFEPAPKDDAIINSKTLAKPGFAESLIDMGRPTAFHDVVLPNGLDMELAAESMMEKFRGRAVPTTGAINANATETVLTMYGMSDSAANEAAYRNDYKAVVAKLNKMFPEGPHSFADKPSKQAVVLDTLKSDMGVGKVDDFSFSGEPAVAATKADKGIMIARFTRSPGF